MSVHEDKLVGVAIVGTTVRVDSKDQSALAIVNRETIAGEKERSFPNGQALLFSVYEIIVHKQSPLHFRLLFDLL